MIQFLDRLNACSKLVINYHYKKWEARGKEVMIVNNNQILRIQAEFKTQLGLIVDQPKQGAGTSNDSN